MPAYFEVIEARRAHNGGMAWKEAAYPMEIFNYMNQTPAIADNDFSTQRDLAAPEYGQHDKVRLFRGVLETLDVDFRTQATWLEGVMHFGLEMVNSWHGTKSISE